MKSIFGDFGLRSFTELANMLSYKTIDQFWEDVKKTGDFVKFIEPFKQGNEWYCQEARLKMYFTIKVSHPPL